jgi:hypothetical protein
MEPYTAKKWKHTMDFKCFTAFCAGSLNFEGHSFVCFFWNMWRQLISS